MQSGSFTAQDRRTLVLASLGGALEFYDFIIFVFFATVIGSLFFPPDTPEWVRQLQTFGIFAAGYLARPLGGVLMAHFGDRVGRKRVFMVSVLLMALPWVERFPERGSSCPSTSRSAGSAWHAAFSLRG